MKYIISLYLVRNDEIRKLDTFTVTNRSVRNVSSFDSCFLVNSADRVIRIYESGEVLACGIGGEPEPVQKLQDLVNK